MSDFERGRPIEGSAPRGGAPHSTVTSRKRDGSAGARKEVLELNSAEHMNGKDGKDKRTYGRTPDGTGEWFAVPDA